jgi:hypothetical protein
LPSCKDRRNIPPPAMPMFAVKVIACWTLREELRMIGRERRGRMFVERPADFGDHNHDRDHNRGGGADPSGDDGDRDVGGDDDNQYACTFMFGLRRKLHEFFRRLKRSTYLLLASLSTFDDNGKRPWGGGGQHCIVVGRCDVKAQVRQ